MRKQFASLAGGDPNHASHTSVTRKAEEDLAAPPVDTPEAPAAPAATEVVTTEPNVPEGAQKIEGEIYLTPEGDLTIVPEAPLEIEGLEEPVTQLDIELHSEEEAPAEPAPAELTTAPAEPASQPEMSDEEASAMMRSCNEPGCHMSFVKAGTTEDPNWVLFKNGSLFATIAFSNQENADGSAKEFFASESFAAKVTAASASLGWHTVLTNLKAKLITDKGLVTASAPVDREALKAEVRTQLFNDAQIAYAAMRGRARTYSLAAKLFDKACEAGVENPEAFTASVMDDVEGKFISELFDVTAEVNKMSNTVKKEFKAMIDRTVAAPAPVRTAAVRDENLMARLASASLPIAPAAAPAQVPQGPRFSGLFNL